jgi:hypothetical protein
LHKANLRAAQFVWRSANGKFMGATRSPPVELPDIRPIG